MNTQTHILMGAALFGDPASDWQTLAAAAGGLAPDLPLIAMVLGARWIFRRLPREIFGTLYFSRGWQAWLAPWHSLPLWLAGSAVASAAGTGAAVAFAVSGLVHVACDFFLHNTDAHRQFWPFSDWRFRSPVSYWDTAHHGRVFRPFEMLLAVGFTLLLMRQHASAPWIAGLSAILALYALQIGYFLRALRECRSDMRGKREAERGIGEEGCRKSRF